MNNFKKFVAVLLGVVMACVFATSAFAAGTVQDTEKAKNELKSYLASKGITTVDNTIASLTADQLTYIRDNQASLEASLEATKAAIDNNNVAAANDAAESAKSILAAAGVVVTGEVTLEDGKAVAVASVTNTAVSNAAKDVVSKNVGSNNDNNTTSNGTETSSAAASAAKNSAAASSVKTVSSAANPITASSSAVIKATGDNSAVVFVVAALAVAGVLGMAVRKERAL